MGKRTGQRRRYQTIVAAVYPGAFWIRRAYLNLSTSPEKAAKKVIYLIASDKVKGITGKYFVKNKITKTSKLTLDNKLQQQLWNLSCELTNIECEK